MLTGDERRELRALVDRAVRDRLSRVGQRSPLLLCWRCGSPHELSDLRAADCPSCRERVYGQRKRQRRREREAAAA
jgi:DNA-directed RNA polymerase subunit RPC12/RpoP